MVPEGLTNKTSGAFATRPWQAKAEADEPNSPTIVPESGSSESINMCVCMVRCLRLGVAKHARCLANGFKGVLYKEVWAAAESVTAGAERVWATSGDLLAHEGSQCMLNEPGAM